MNQQERWQLAGNAPEIYERHLVPAIFGPWAPIVVELGRLLPGERVLDVACGTGIVARVAAKYVGSGGRVVGLDINPAMLAIAGLLPPAPGAVVEWREASADAMPFPGATFDVVFCQLGLQYFPDRPAALREMHRVLVERGRLVLMVWRPIQFSPGFAMLADALEHRVSPEAAAVMRAPFSLGDPGSLRALIEGGDFHNLTIRPATGTVQFPSPEDFVRHQVAGSPLAGHVAKVDDQARAALLTDIKEALRPYFSAGGLKFPIEAQLAVAQA